MLRLLSKHKAHWSASFGVTGLALFGSSARDRATASSDVDIRVSFDGPATSDIPNLLDRLRELKAGLS